MLYSATVQLYSAALQCYSALCTVFNVPSLPLRHSFRPLIPPPRKHQCGGGAVRGVVSGL
jgi:hypothetical protein